MLHRTKQQAIYEELRSRIVDGRLEPGQRLNVRELARQLGASEIPVREAINRLQAEGFVTVYPYSGAMVAPLSADDMLQITEIRDILEVAAACRACGRITPAGMEQLREIHGEMRARVAAGNLEAYGRLNRNFHQLIYSFCGNPRLYGLIDHYWDLSERGFAVFRLVPGHADRSVAEHGELLAALADEDPARVEALMRAHRERANRGVRRLLELASAADGRGGNTDER